MGTSLKQNKEEKNLLPEGTGFESIILIQVSSEEYVDSIF
jgi:hypothetical protein